MSEKKIDGKEFRVQEILATDALRLQVRVTKVLGGGITRLPEILAGRGDSASELDKNTSNEAAIAAFTDIFVNNDTDDMVNLIKDLVELAEVKQDSGQWRSADLDGDFTGKMIPMLECAMFVLKEVFGDFLSGALALGNRQKKAD